MLNDGRIKDQSVCIFQKLLPGSAEAFKKMLNTDILSWKKSLLDKFSADAFFLQQYVNSIFFVLYLIY